MIRHVTGEQKGDGSPVEEGNGIGIGGRLKRKGILLVSFEW